MRIAITTVTFAFLLFSSYPFVSDARVKPHSQRDGAPLVAIASGKFKTAERKVEDTSEPPTETASTESGPGEWLVVDPSGRFDAGVLEKISSFSWIISDDPFRPMSPEVFMRDYYEPRLLSRLFACHEAEARGDADACAKAFKPVRPLAELNRIQPDVRIVRVERGASADEAVVDVEVAEKRDPSQKNGKTETGVYDLRLFRNGQIVGQWPQLRGGMGGVDDPEQWRIDTKVPMAAGDSKIIHRFTVQLSGRDMGKPVTFTAYAFNEDRVKSETSVHETYRVPGDVRPAKPRAYVITIGVNVYENPYWKLGFAVKDAQDLSAALQRIRGYEVVSVQLVSADKPDARQDQATKANIRAVLRLLAENSESDRAHVESVIGSVATELRRVTPDDLVIIAFSGHGYTDPRARFYLLPSDSGSENTISDAMLSKFISSEELSEWLKNVDAGEMLMLIDACYSAASVPEGFKPGPMGDRGLGQLAYDKGMQILAATQADNIAVESQKLGQGLLTYALVQDGLKARKAAPIQGSPITVRAWLRYAQKRVPELYEDIRLGKLKLVGFDSQDGTRQLVSKNAVIDPTFYSQTAQQAQIPALFDFSKRNNDPVLESP